MKISIVFSSCFWKSMCFLLNEWDKTTKQTMIFFSYCFLHTWGIRKTFISAQGFWLNLWYCSTIFIIRCIVHVVYMWKYLNYKHFIFTVFGIIPYQNLFRNTDKLWIQWMFTDSPLSLMYDRLISMKWITTDIRIK